MRIRLLAVFGLALLAFIPSPARTGGSDDQPPANKPLPPKDAAKAMTLPPGFKATLFAGEPDIVQPIAMAFDDRGRLWVVECLSYPKWRADGTGNDRVVILEDTDGDGVHDKKTVFLDNGSNLSGIEFGFGGVWLCSLPNLIFIPVKPGEDKPSGPPEIVLDGWNLKDTKHNVFNSLAWGPDGWLYGCNGIQARSRVGKPGTPDKDRVLFDCGVWRYHPTKKVFEPFAYGTTNPFGLDWDENGELFITNCVLDHLYHFAPGGHYERMYGQDPVGHVFTPMTSCVDYKHWAGGDWTSSRPTTAGLKPEHADAGGGHAHSGCVIYLGDNFPKEYRNTLFTCNIHGNRLNNDGLERTPTGMKGVRRSDFAFANDPWFRGICLKTGPDGGLFVSDWCDTGECHNYDVADTTNGRVFKITFGTPKPWTGDISKMTDAELVKLQLHPNEWFVRKARRVLQERIAADKLEGGQVAHLFTLMYRKENALSASERLRAFWAFRAIVGCWPSEPPPFTARPGGNAPTLFHNFLSDSDERVRLHAVRWAMDLSRGSTVENAAILRVLAANGEKSATVWAAAAPALRHLPREEAGKESLAAQLLGRKDIAADANLSKLVWYSAAEWLLRNPDAAVSPLLAAASPLIRQNTCRLMLTQPQPKLDENLNRLVTELTGNRPAEVNIDILRGIREGLAGRTDVKAPSAWPLVFIKLRGSSTEAVVHAVEAAGVALGDPVAIAELSKRLTDPKASAESRQFALEVLSPRKLPGFGTTLRELLADPALRGAAVRGLAAFPDADTPAAILKHYPAFTAAEKADAVQTLASRPAWANALLDAVEKQAVPRADVPVVTARQILALNDKALSARLEKTWGKITPASKERAALIAKWKAELPPEKIKAADPAKGRVLFTQHCGACHKMFGDGGAVGPELTGSQRTNLDYVLENVLDPSAVVPREFKLINFTLTDGRVVAGIIQRETPAAVTVRTVNDTVVLPVGDIEGRKETNQSIMPEGLFDALKPDEVRDLVAYLAAVQQVPLPKK